MQGEATHFHSWRPSKHLVGSGAHWSAEVRQHLFHLPAELLLLPNPAPCFRSSSSTFFWIVVVQVVPVIELPGFPGASVEQELVAVDGHIGDLEATFLLLKLWIMGFLLDRSGRRRPNHRKLLLAMFHCGSFALKLVLTALAPGVGRAGRDGDGNR